MKKKKSSERLKIGYLITALFIVSASIGYGIEITEDLVNDEIINNGVVVNINNLGISITNNGTITSNSISGISYKGDNTTTIGVGIIKNNGIILITSTPTSNFTGNGIDIFSSITDMDDINNSGIISATSMGSSFASGNGISVYSDSLWGNIGNANMDDINNSGIISGTSNSRFSGNGIFFMGNSDNIVQINGINNSGIISGTSNSTSSGNDMTGNGIFTRNNNTLNSIEEINNSGIISGTSMGNNLNNLNSGNGINVFNYKPVAKMGNINNSGIIKGTNQSVKGTFTSLINNGILAGKDIVDTGNLYTNNGITITLNADNSRNIASISNGTGVEVTLGDGSTKQIINGNKNSAGTDSSLLIVGGDGKDMIINGAGVEKGALTIDTNREFIISDSIVNGYNTALYLENDSKITATNTIFNGGGLKNDVAVIRGSEGANEVTLLGNSIINGSVDLGNGDDILLLANTTQINGTLNGGLGDNDTLGLGQSSTATNLNVLYNISGFETINTNGDITLFETITVTDADSINLESGNLTLRVDPTKVDTVGKITGHALYGNIGTLNSTGGNLVIGLNGLGENAVVSMGGTTITQNTNDSWWEDSDHLTTNSLVLDAKLSTDGKDVTITVKESLPLGPSTPVIPLIPLEPSTPIVNAELYNKLNEVYKSIVSSGEIGVLANTTLIDFVTGDSYLETVNGSTGKTFEESLGGLLTVLDQIYVNNPYSYTLKSSRDSLKLFEDNMSYLTIKPEAKEWLVQGRAIYTGVKNDNESSGKNYYGFDTGHRNYNTTTNTIGGLATLEYGLSDKTSLGLVLGGNNQHINFKGTSKIDGNSLYVGTFIKTEINKLKLMSGLSYQYTSATAERGVSNEYDSFRTSDKYDINSFNTFVEAKYLLASDKQWKVEPKIRLSYYYVSQDRVNEGYTPSQLSIEVDKANSNTADVEIGLDFTKEILLSRGKLNNIISVGVINTLGNKEKSLEGNIIGKDRNGSKFEIKGIELPTTAGKVSYDLEYEQINGMIYSAGVDFEFAKDYNRNINVTLGMGYKF